MEKSLNIVFFGENNFSNVVLESLIQSRHHISLVIAPIYKELQDKKLYNTCVVNNVCFERYQNINTAEVTARVAELAPDICIVANVRKIIKKPLMDVPKMGFINIHPSLLPYYRGLSPEHWPIINGEKESGVTVHYIDEGTDTGDIILQRRFPITEDMYVSDLQDKWVEIYRTIVVDALDCILNNQETIKQTGEVGSYYGKISDEQRTIRVEEGVQKAYNMVRAFSFPYEGALYNDVVIFKAEIYSREKQKDLEGKIWSDGEERFYLGFPDGILELTLSTLE